MKDRRITPIEVQRYLGGVKYPAGKSGLIDRARMNKADEPVVVLLRSLADRDFASPADLSHAISGLTKK